MQGQRQKQCPRCGQIAPLNAFKCERCGRDFKSTAPPAPPLPDERTTYLQPAPPQPPPAQPVQDDRIRMAPGTHSVSVAVVLAVLVGGWAAALYNRQYAKGAVQLFCFIGVVASSPAMLILAAYIVGIIDSIFIAQRLNRGEPVGLWQFF